MLYASSIGHHFNVAVDDDDDFDCGFYARTFDVCMHGVHMPYVTFVLSNRNSIPHSLQGWLYFASF